MSNKRQPFKLFQTFRSSVWICQGAEAGETSSSLELNKTKIFLINFFNFTQCEDKSFHLLINTLFLK